MKRKSIIACVLSTLVLTASLNLSFATYAAEEDVDNAEAAFERGNGLGYIEDNLITMIHVPDLWLRDG